MSTLEEQFQVDFPPKLTEVIVSSIDSRRDGGEMATVIKAKEKYAMTTVEDDDLVCFDWIEFKPGSAKDRIDVLWDAGWKPVDKTKTAINFSRKKVGDPYGKSVASMDEDFYNQKKKDLD